MVERINANVTRLKPSIDLTLNSLQGISNNNYGAWFVTAKELLCHNCLDPLHEDWKHSACFRCRK